MAGQANSATLLAAFASACTGFSQDADHVGAVRGTNPDIIHWCLAIEVSRVHVRSMGDQKSHHIVIADRAIPAIERIVKRRHSKHAVPSIDPRASGHEQFGFRDPAVPRNIFKNRGLITMLHGIWIGARLQQYLHDVEIVYRTGRQNKQWRASEIVAGIDSGASLQKDSGDFRLSGQDCLMQWSQAAKSRRLWICTSIQEHDYGFRRTQGGGQANRASV